MRMLNGNEAYKSQQAALTEHSYFNLVFEYSLTCLLLFFFIFLFFFHAYLHANAAD